MSSYEYSWEVRFTCYQYNSGRSDNGYYDFVEKFRDEHEAKKFYRKISKIIELCKKFRNNYSTKGQAAGSASSILARQYLGYDGHLHSLNGLYEISRKEVKCAL